MIPGATAPYKAALAALRNNPAVLLDLNEDVFFETTPMEHLQLLLKFMNGPESVANMISQDEEDPKPPVLKNQASGSFVPNVGGLEEMKNNYITPAAHKEIISSVLPQQATPHLNGRSPKCEFLTPRLFRRGDYNAHRIWEDFLPSTSDHGAHGLVKNEAKVKDESFDSTIFQNYDGRTTRFFYSPTNDTNMKAESSVFNTYNGSIGHRRKPKSIPIAFQSTANSLLTAKPRESSKVPKNQGLSSFDLVKLVSTKIDEASKLYTCKTCKRNFKQKCHLYRHQRQHSGVKRFFCIHCNRGFYQRSNLSAHDRTHSNDSSISHRYSCTFCTKRFTRKSSLMKHLVRHSKGLIKMK